jgi:hypothetical protein
MQRAAERQHGFAAALLDAGLPAPPGLVGPDGEPSPRRFAVYRNNVVAGLADVLKEAFPAVCRVVGIEFFRAMARDYVVLEPPSSPILLDYGAGFPDFIGAFEPAASLPYLRDVARIERAWTEAYHAPEAAPVDPAVFMARGPAGLPEIRLLLHPSVRIVRSAFPALTIWRMNVGDGVAAPVDLAAGAEDILVARPMTEVEVWPMPEGGPEFLQTLGAGASVLEATKAAVTADGRFDLSANLSQLIRARVFVAFSFARIASSQKSARRACPGSK